MTQDETIRRLRQEMQRVYDEILDYFEYHASKKVEATSPSWREENHWEQMSDEEQRRSEQLAGRFIDTMSRVASAVRNSPLLDGFDQQDLPTITKAMHAAIFVRKYRHWDPYLLSNEDVAFGMAPGCQEEDGSTVNESRRAFLQGWETGRHKPIAWPVLLISRFLAQDIESEA